LKGEAVLNQEYICLKCGKKIIDSGFRFCPFCGERIESAISLLSSFCSELLKGNDPLTMDLFFEDVNKATPEVEQIVKIVLKQIKREKSSNNIKSPQRRGQRWSEEEDHQLKQEYLNKLPFKDICKNHGRSRHAVQLRIMKLFPEIVVTNER
jgi:hypothetical protein